MTPTVSALMPVYNTERYIRASAESVFSQTYDDFELLALNDGSTDKSLLILRECAAKDSRMRVISRENRGLVQTRNDLVAAARGRYLALIDSDDVCRPQRFEKQVAYLNAHPECVAVGSRSLIIDSSGMPIIESRNELTHDEIDGAHLSGQGGTPMYNSSVMMRREAVIRAGQYRDYAFAAEDLDLFLRLAEIGKLANLPDILLEYRQHLCSISYTFRDGQHTNARKAIRAAWLRRGITGNSEISHLPMNPQTAADAHRKWAWWALSAGNRATARKHAIIALARNPFSLENLRVLACALRGY
jgi:glycosyltransferase involved in cell wall biosynthesis